MESMDQKDKKGKEGSPVPEGLLARKVSEAAMAPMVSEDQKEKEDNEEKLDRESLVVGKVKEEAVATMSSEVI